MTPTATPAHPAWPGPTATSDTEPTRELGSPHPDFDTAARPGPALTPQPALGRAQRTPGAARPAQDTRAAAPEFRDPSTGFAAPTLELAA
ncbi:hypothetical protein [Kitasatospora sp. NPDC004531]